MKLTQAKKDIIKRKVVAEKFNPLFAAQVAKEELFANNLLDAIPGVSDLPNSPYPKNWFACSSSVYASFNGWGRYLNLGMERMQPYYVTSDNKGLRFAQDAEETKAFLALEHSKEVLNAEKRELEQEIDKVLRAVTTEKRLKEVWPEAVQYLPVAPAPVPAIVTVDRLRDLLTK